MKQILAVMVLMSLALPALADTAANCRERRTDLMIATDSILIYDSQFTHYLKSLKKSEQTSMAAEYKEEFDRRIVELEATREAFEADCVQ